MQFRVIMWSVLLLALANMSYMPLPPHDSLTQYRAEGKWVGHIYQNSETGLARKYSFELELFIDQGGALSGFSTIRMTDDPTTYGVLSLTGNFAKQTLNITEKQVIDEHIYSYAYWCIKSYSLTFEQKDGKLTLTGKWNSENCTGMDSIYLEKVPDDKE